MPNSVEIPSGKLELVEAMISKSNLIELLIFHELLFRVFKVIRTEPYNWKPRIKDVVTLIHESVVELNA